MTRQRELKKFGGSYGIHISKEDLKDDFQFGKKYDIDKLLLSESPLSALFSESQNFDDIQKQKIKKIKEQIDELFTSALNNKK